MSTILIVLAVVIGVPLLFAACLLFEIVCGQSPAQHMARMRAEEERDDRV